MLKEFKEFAVKGNVIDMGVGIVVGAAFTTIVKSFITDIINPVIGTLTGGVDFSDWIINLTPEACDYTLECFTNMAVASQAGALTINYGLFLNAIVSFLIVAWVLFLVIRGINRLKRKEEKTPKIVMKPKQEVLLEEIRDLLAKK